MVEYDPAWPARFEQLRREYAAAMAAAGVPVVAIEHVGSTSVPGLAAKPIIDCDIIVAEPDVAAASQALAGLGFTPEGDLGIPLRWAFKEPARLAGTNTYVIVEGCLSLRNHLAVRDILRQDAGLREQYAAVKRRVGATAADINEYGRGKNAVVQQILAAAGLTDAERASIDHANLVPTHAEQDQGSRDQRVISEFRANGVRVGGCYAQMSLLLLGTTGRRSGRRYTTPLSYLADGDRYVVVAAAGGAAADPDWYRNLVTRPQVTVEVGHEEFEATAFVLQGAERAATFQRFAAAQPVLTRYQDMTARPIPVIALTRLR